VFKNAQFTPNEMCKNVNGKIETAYSEEEILAGSIGLK